ncbi:MAG: hypothetical protein V4722_11025 [Bacteroidota bacterium]
MENPSSWFEFMNLAQSLLLKGQVIDNYKPNIQIAVEPSFDNSIFLQIVINNEEVQWYRTTWMRFVDLPKFSNPIEGLKYIGQVITPTIIKESGTTNIKKLKGIIEFAKGLSIKPNFEKWGGIIIDGTCYTLVIGVESTQTTYKWHYLPDSWIELEKMADMLEELNRDLV